MKNPYTSCSQVDLQLFGSGSRIRLGQVFLSTGKKDAVATFDVFVRDMPKNRNYLVASGIDDVLDFITNFKFTKKQVKFLKRSLNLSKEMYEYLLKMKPSCDVWAVREGSIIFPNQPIMRITAPVIFGAIIEQYVINTIMHQTMLASKLSRVVNASNGVNVGFVPVRTHGVDSALKAVRIGKMVGFTRADMMLPTYREELTQSGGLFTTHYFILSFDSEVEAFRALANKGGRNMAILIDTFNFEQGINNFITVAKETESKGFKMNAIAIDSGNLLTLSKKARRMLDRSNLKYIKIVVASNLDEYSINALVKKNAPVDFFAPCTEILNVTDAPKLEVVYKMSEIRERGEVKHRMKFSPNKISLPGTKQVFRFKEKGKYVHDLIGLSTERSKGVKLLELAIKKGKLILEIYNLESSKEHYQNEILKFDKKLLSVEKQFDYKVSLTLQLSSLVKRVREKHYIS